jgi:hypothetical protein
MKEDNLIVYWDAVAQRGFLTLGASNRSGHHKHEMNFRKSQSFIEFPIIWLNNLTFVKGRIFFFNLTLKYSFCCPLDSAPRGRLQRLLPPSKPHYCWELIAFYSANPQKLCRNMQFLNVTAVGA